MKLRHFLITLFLLMTAVVCASAGGLGGLSVEYLREPLGIDVRQPRFGWQMLTEAGRTGQRQKAYRLTVKDDSGRTVWDTGWRRTAQSVGVAYGGSALRPMTRYEWQVEVTDERGRKLSAQSWFETGLMDTAVSAWHGAQWIGVPADKGRTLRSHRLGVFKVAFTVQLDARSRSTRASFLYGANDERLMNRNLNAYGISSRKDSSYVRIEIDTHGLDAGGQAVVSVYRHGYSPKDGGERRLKTFNIPATSVNKANRYAAHRLMVASNLGYTDIYVDDMLKAVGRVGVNPEGQGGDFEAYPVLADVGFMVDGGQRASLSGVEVIDFRSPANKITDVPELNLSGKSGFIATVDPSRGGLPVLRRGFRIDKPVGRARLYVTARGVYDFYVNGQLTGRDYLNPGSTQYNKTQLYQTFDVTPLLHLGGNAIGAVLAEGWWSGEATFQGENWNYFGDRQSLLAMLVVTHTDGTVSRVVSDPQHWTCTTQGPYISGSLFQGEEYDARTETAFKGWAAAGFDDSGWQRAVQIGTRGTVSSSTWGNGPAVDDFTEMKLTGQTGGEVRAVDTLRAVKVEQVRPGVYVYDMGQNMAGVPMVRFGELRAGQRVRLRYAEVCYPDLPEYAANKGMIMLENIRAAMATDIYTARGAAVEEYSPRFTYHGYRYVEVTGIDSPAQVAEMQGLVLSSLHELKAAYTSSDTLLNRLWQNIAWSARANFLSVPTDCPQRNERLGWAGDISVFSRTATFLGDNAQFLGSYLRSMRDVQHADGRMPDIAPLGGGFGGLLWGSASITVPWECYRQYEDTVMLRENYAAMKRYMEYVAAHYIDPASGIIVQERKWGDLGDWLGPEDAKNDKPLLWECYYIYDLDIMSRVAAVLGLDDDSRHWAALAAGRRRLFGTTFVNADGRTVASDFTKGRRGRLVDTQTSYVLPLVFGIVDGERKAQMARNLAETVMRRNTMDNGRTAPEYSLMTGFIGTAWISKALSDNGMTEQAYRQLLNREYPSWLYPVMQGATTIWERLNSYTHKDGFGGNNRMNSFNHYSFGAVGSWLVNYSLGIRRNEHEPGFQHFTLQPEPDPTGRLTHASGYYDSPYGRIESSWTRRADGRTEYVFTIPANTEATVILPAAKGKKPKMMRLGSGRHRLIKN